MLFDIVTIFPNFFDSPLKDGVVRRAIEADILKVRTINLRDFTTDRHRTVDDRPFGGGEGTQLTRLLPSESPSSNPIGRAIGETGLPA